MQTSSEKIIHLGDETKTRERILMNFIYPDEYPLSEKEEWILSRWKQVYTLKKRFKADGTTIKMLVGWTELQGKKISESTAYRDLCHAQWFYGDLFNQDPLFKLLLYAEWYEELTELARKANNFKVAKECLDGAVNLRLKLLAESKKDGAKDKVEETVKNFNMQVNIMFQNGSTPKEKVIALDDLKNIVSQEHIEQITNNVPTNILSRTEKMAMLRKSKNNLTNGEATDAE